MRAIESETVDGIVFPSLIRASEKKNREEIVAEARLISDIQTSSNERRLPKQKSPASAALHSLLLYHKQQARHVAMWITAARLSWQMSPAAPRQQHRGSSQKV